MRKKVRIIVCTLLIVTVVLPMINSTDNTDKADSNRALNNIYVDDESGCKTYNKMSDNYRENLFIGYPVMSNPIYVDLFDLDESFPKPTIVDTPDEFSWKNYEGRDWTTPAKYQSNCGCCWDFSAIGALESIIKIRENCAELNPDLSEQYVLSCLPDAANTPGEGCYGGDSYNAFLYMMDTSSEGNYHNGIIPESCFPYQASDDIPCEDKCENWENYLVPILNCEEIILPGVLSNDPEAIDVIKSQIMINGPVASYMNVTEHFESWGIKHHKLTDYYPYVEEEWANMLNHAIVIVGWKDDPSIGNGGYWICKNSWDNEWGYDGFFNIEYGSLFTGVIISCVDYDPNSFDWPPIAPVVTGPIRGKAGEEHEYTFITNDPDGDDDIYYYIDWGDGQVEEWIGPYQSDEEVIIKHTWLQKDTYLIKAKAKDINDVESDWSDPLVLTISKNKNLNSLIIGFIKNYLDAPLCSLLSTESKYQNLLHKADPIDYYKINDKYFTPPSIIWNKTYGGNSFDWGWSISKTSGGGFIIGGETISFSAGSYDAFLIKTDSNGNEEWNKTFGGSAKDGCRAVKQTDDGGYILAGYADSYGYPGHDYWLIRTDENGEELWNYTYGGQNSDAAVSVIQTSAGDFVMAGYSYTNSHGGKDVWVVKTDENGNELWNDHYGGIGNDQGMSVVESTDGGYVIAGYTSSFGSGGTDMWLVKIDMNGGYEWDQCFGGNDDDWAGSIDLTLEGGYIISGDTKSYGNGGYDVWVIKTDNNGIEEWNQVFGDGNCHETGYCIKQTSDGGYIISGTKFIVNHDNALFIKTDINGNEEWNMTIITDQSDIIYSICETDYDSYASTGYTYTYGAGNMDIWLLNIGNINNQPPNKPAKPSGPANGKAGEEHTYSSSTTGPDGDQIHYWFDWGDGENSGWIGPFDSGVEASASHIWDEKGNYEIKVKAKNIYSVESDWSDPLVVSMPKNRALEYIQTHMLFDLFKGRFPIFNFLINSLEREI